MKCDCYGYLKISWTFWGLRGVNLMDICEYHGYSRPMKGKSPWYLGPMKQDLLDIWDLWRANLMDICKSPGHSLISWIFRAYEAYEVQMLWMFKNLMDILGPKGSQSHGYLWISWLFQTYEALISWKVGAYEARISWIVRAYEAQISRIFANSWIFRAYEVLDVLGLYDKM